VPGNPLVRRQRTEDRGRIETHTLIRLLSSVSCPPFSPEGERCADGSVDVTAAPMNAARIQVVSLVRSATGAPWRDNPAEAFRRSAPFSPAGARPMRLVPYFAPPSSPVGACWCNVRISRLPPALAGLRLLPRDPETWLSDKPPPRTRILAPLQESSRNAPREREHKD
jgi:hypothetical protein